MKQNLQDAFAIKRDSHTPFTDYEVFKDKELLEEFRTKIIEHLADLDIKDNKDIDDVILKEIAYATEGIYLTNLQHSHLYHLIDNEIRGVGPITELLEDDNVSAIYINSPKDIYILHDGKLSKDTSISFINEEHIIRTINKMTEQVGQSISLVNPIMDVNLLNGLSISMIMPPISKSVMVTIKKFKAQMVTMDDLVRKGTLTPYMARFLEAAIRSKCNIVITGKYFSGKTTLLNVLGSLLSDDARIATVENGHDFAIQKEHLLSLYINQYKEENLIKEALAMYPEFLFVKELNEQNADVLIEAMNTGQAKVLTSIHSKDMKDAMRKIETMILSKKEKLPREWIRTSLKDGIDLVINIEQLNDLTRKITAISEIKGFNKDEMELEDIFAYNSKDEFILYKKTPAILKKFHEHNIHDVDAMFKQK